MVDSAYVKSSDLIVPRSFIDDFCATINITKRSLPSLYGLFLELTRQLYSDEDNLLLGLKTIWNEDPKKSTIWIDTEYIWEDKNPDFRPAIYISIGDLRKERLVLNDALDSDVKEGIKSYTRKTDGIVKFVHIGHTKGETVYLTSNTADYLEGLSKVIRDDFCFQKFEVTTVTPLKVYKEAKDHLRGEVIAQFGYNDEWSVKTESPKLKKIIYNTRQGIINLVH